MPSSIEITSLTKADAPTVAEFVYLLIDEFAPGAGPDRRAMTAIAQEVLPLESVSGFLAKIDSTPVGVMLINECAAIYAGGKFGEISELYVRPEYRSKGVAAPLLDAAGRHAEDSGWKRLEVGAPNQPAWERTLKFYLREGFEEVGPRLRKLISQEG
ncbi:MAG: GNAT family N-acetyltransferase [Paracoccaceae bacterium]